MIINGISIVGISKLTGVWFSFLNILQRTNAHIFNKQITIKQGKKLKKSKKLHCESRYYKQIAIAYSHST